MESYHKSTFGVVSLKEKGKRLRSEICEKAKGCDESDDVPMGSLAERDTNIAIDRQER